MSAILIRSMVSILSGLCFIISIGDLGLTASIVGGQATSQVEKDQTQIIFQIGDYVLTTADLEQLSDPSQGLGVPRESRAELIESLIGSKLFSLAARAAKMDASEEFRTARDATRDSITINLYIDRHVGPKFSEAAAQAYFAAHKDELKYYSYYRNDIVIKLEREAIAEAKESLMKQWKVRLHRDVKTLNLRTTDPSLVLAEIEGEPVTVEDLIELAEERYEGINMGAVAEKYKVELFDRFMLERLGLLEAKKSGFVTDPQVLKEVAAAEENILTALYTARIQSKVTIESARRYYQDHLEEFKIDQIRARQVVLPTAEEARSVRTRLNAGEAFEDVAKAVSTDRASAGNGGNIGWVRQGRLHPEVEKVAFRLKPRQVSEPIKTPHGYVIVKVEERIEGTMKPFDEVAGQILLQLKMQAVEAERKRLMTVYKVTINKDLLD